MSLFAIADLHLSLGTNKPMDVFGPRWANANQKLEKNWRAKIAPEDTVVIAGDISWGMTPEEALPDLLFLDSLPGKKLLLKGNHDYWWSTRKKLETLFVQNNITSLDLLFNNAFAVGRLAVCGSRGWDIFGESEQDLKLKNREELRLRESLRQAAALGGEPVAFLHYPPLSPVSPFCEFADLLSEAGVRRCFYGHLHAGGQSRAFLGSRKGTEYRLISADTINFDPVFIEE